VIRTVDDVMMMMMMMMMVKKMLTTITQMMHSCDDRFAASASNHNLSKAFKFTILLMFGFQGDKPFLSSACCHPSPLSDPRPASLAAVKTLYHPLGIPCPDFPSLFQRNRALSHPTLNLMPRLPVPLPCLSDLLHSHFLFLPF
jgi:hypothetical protein